MKRLIGTLSAALIGTVLLTTITSCGSDDAPGKEATNAPEAKTLTVFAAASLKGAFTDIGKLFEAEHEGVKVVFSFAGSSDLVAQIQQGAPADVFASADIENMDKAVADALLNSAPVEFASNSLQIVTPPDNPAKVDSLDDLAAPGIKVVLCAPEVPCGAAAQRVEEAAGIDIKPVSEEASVTDVLNKVVTGEADAGLVYVTDALGAGDKVMGVTLDESANAVNTYPIAALKASKQAGLASQFVDLVTSGKGQDILAGAGFAQP